MGTLIYSLYSCFLVLISLTELLIHGHSKTHWRDIGVLTRFKNGLNPNSITPGSCLSSWDFSLDPCDNLSGEYFTCGLRCDVVTSRRTSRITEITLDQAGYSGPLNSTSWNLPYLQSLQLSNNFFSGPIPNSFSGLTRLQRLSLSDNSLSDTIPDSLGSLEFLEEVYLDNNKLTGTIPLSLNGLKNLKRLELQGNQLTGSLPDLSRLSNLYFFDASDNAVSGALPASLPPSLVELSVRSNRIEGSVPASLVDSAYLQVLDLSHNQLVGSVPSGFFTHPSLEQLTLSYNHFGSVEEPENSGPKSELIAVDLSNNDLRGLLPEFMGRMPRLSSLSLENNKLSGMIPAQYAVKAVLPDQGVAPFQRLLLGGNYLLGLIPSPLLQLKPGSATVRLGDNCLYRCPMSFFFCDGGVQKSLMECKTVGPVVP